MLLLPKSLGGRDGWGAHIVSWKKMSRRRTAEVSPDHYMDSIFEADGGHKPL